MTIDTVDLRAEAEAEARRLTAARALLRGGDARALASLEGSATWIAMPRRTSLKQSLCSQLCLVWRIVVEDESGRVVESRLVAVLVKVEPHARGLFDGAPQRRARILSLLRDTDEIVRARVEAASDGWRASVMRVTSAFTSARLSREHDLEPQPAASSAGSQPGLFDRRVERSRLANEAAAAESARTAADRVHTIRTEGSIAFRPAQLLLVLVP